MGKRVFLQLVLWVTPRDICGSVDWDMGRKCARLGKWKGNVDGLGLEREWNEVGSWERELGDRSFF